MSNLIISGGGEHQVLNTNYSTNETKTGETWIDGKPVYCSVYDTNSPNTSWGEVFTTIPKVECIVSCDYFGVRTNGEVITGYVNDQTYDIFNVHLCQRTNQQVLSCFCKSTSVLNRLCVIVYYTKAT